MTGTSHRKVTNIVFIIHHIAQNYPWCLTPLHFKLTPVNFINVLNRFNSQPCHIVTYNLSTESNSTQ
ncbi:Uncharacterised protein [Escherichia coli]|nr:Uncharacterised protein [Escherichia coli]